MLYYIYIGGYAAYKLYEYWGVMRFFAYTTYSYTYSAVNGVYRWVIPAPICLEEINKKEKIKGDKEDKEDDWDMCEP